MITCPCMLIYHAHEQQHFPPPPKVRIMTPAETKRTQARYFRPSRSPIPATRPTRSNFLLPLFVLLLFSNLILSESIPFLLVSIVS